MSLSDSETDSREKTKFFVHWRSTSFCISLRRATVAGGGDVARAESVQRSDLEAPRREVAIERDRPR